MDAPPAIDVPTLRFVHYPGAQPLLRWLPQSGYLGYGDVTVTHNGALIEKATVRDCLNGSVQILWDTLVWPPGDYRIVITHTDGWHHEATLQKLEQGVALPQPEPPPAPPPSDAPIIYRDGFGNVIPDTDLEIRAQAQAKLAHTFGRRIEYEGTLRAGLVIYIDAIHRIVFENELCGGALHATIYIPSAAHWGMPPARPCPCATRSSPSLPSGSSRRRPAPAATASRPPRLISIEPPMTAQRGQGILLR